MLKNIFVFVNIFAKILIKTFVYVNIFVKFSQESGICMKDTFFIHCHIISVLSRLPIGRFVLTNLSLLSSPSCSVPDVLSKMCCPGPSVLSCPSCPLVPAAPTKPHWPLLSCHQCHVLAPMSCPGSPVISVLFQTHMSRLPVWTTCREFPIPTVLSRVSCPSYPV
jgi:hypothetical protein